MKSTLTLLILMCLIQELLCLKPFDPWPTEDKGLSCKPTMNSCSFVLRATSQMTMFHKELYRVVATDDGILHKYDDENTTFPMDSIITADGYPKLVYVFNHSLPGPALHVYEGQKISVEIINDLPTESLSVHFHGIRQYFTPQSDGIGRLTQLSILPGSSFTHQFNVIDQGTFWYHSHVNTQTSMGLLGAFVVHPKERPQKANSEFVLVLKDWEHFYTGEQHQHLVESSQFYPNSLESLTQSGTIDYFQAVDGSYAAEALVTSILVNGRGQYFDPRTMENSTTPYERLLVDRSEAQYRIRLINGGSSFSIKFSIDEHQLEVVSTDGVPLAQSKVVDEIIIGLGERYELLINVTTNTSQDAWWIRVETMDKNNNPRWQAKAILQFSNQSYLIKPVSERKVCSTTNKCLIFNCPFTQYGAYEDRSCLTMKDLRTDSAHLDQELISKNASINIYQSLSLTMVEGEGDESGYESINYISMKYPKMMKPILYDPQQARQLNACLNKTDVSENELGQRCYHHIIAQYNDLIEFLVVNYDTDQHPMHLHGFYFHVIEQGLSVLNTTTGLFVDTNPNVKCDENGINCRCATCNANTQLVKDTMIVPSGGYMRIRFRANNPGVWLFHCHTETHLDRGMALLIHVAEDRIGALLESRASVFLGDFFMIVFSWVSLRIFLSVQE